MTAPPAASEEVYTAPAEQQEQEGAGAEGGGDEGSGGADADPLAVEYAEPPKPMDGPEHLGDFLQAHGIKPGSIVMATLSTGYKYGNMIVSSAIAVRKLNLPFFVMCQDDICVDVCRRHNILHTPHTVGLDMAHARFKGHEMLESGAWCGGGWVRGRTCVRACARARARGHGGRGRYSWRWCCCWRRGCSCSCSPLARPARQSLLARPPRFTPPSYMDPPCRAHTHRVPHDGV